MNDPVKAAEAAQRAASDPKVSAFVGASAGSGKTKLLTDRLLRLMLSGANPARILCLTFTRAAAAEMAIRLRDRLGRWAVLDEKTLDTELETLDVPRTPTNRSRARSLFGTVLDLPGGMRVDTIHAFCQSLLRKFPLEAGISPHFAVSDDAETADRRRTAREGVVGGLKDASLAALRLLAGEVSEQDFTALTDGLLTDTQGRLARLLDRHSDRDAIEAMQRAALGVSDLDETALWAAAVAPPDEAGLRAALTRIAADSSAKAKERALALLDWLALEAPKRLAQWDDWCDGFLTGKGAARAKSAFVSKALDQDAPSLFDAIVAEQKRILTHHDQLAARNLARLSSALTGLMLPIHKIDTEAKQCASRFDYGDLIARAARLLFDPGAAWVLYKLDGGIDHILLDEVQDIAPAQWGVIDAIAQEFFAGESAKSGAGRTIFAVGDRKQSIYSFQGADLASFDAWRIRIGRQVSDARAGWHEGTLETSFRSTAPILALADAVFAEGEARGGVVPSGEILTHGVSRAGQAGSVMLWPLAPADPDPELRPWAVADTYVRQASARRRLAEGLADWIKRQIESGMMLPSRGRALRAGDILILVRTRNEFGPALTRALKDRDVPVAGLDRMMLTENRAVADLIALAQALLLPEDDVAVATVLASPLGGLSDDEVMDLALSRPGSLRDALFARAAERPAFAAARDLFAATQAKADFISPYRLFAEVLGPMGGRARLLARLGPEAAEPIDELLASALDYGRRKPAGLQGFLAALEAADAEIKREAEAAGDSVRLMTVHGAKGLQAPLVILPDTTGMPKSTGKLHWLAAPQSDLAVPVFCPRADQRSTAVTDAADAAKGDALEESNRLLYVALTRAEDHLLICGAASKNDPPASCWYEKVRAGFDRLDGASDAEIGVPWAGQGRIFASTQTAPPDREGRRADTTKKAPLPAWLDPDAGWQAVPPPSPADRIDRLVPSRSTEDKAAGLANASPRITTDMAKAGSGRAAAMARGRLIHALLQHLPDLPESTRTEAAKAYLRQPAHDLDSAAQKDIEAAVAGVLAHPALAPLFGPEGRAEAPVAGIVNGMEIGGLIDRLAIFPDRIVIADYKT
ncbi:MAG TPA: double-strand break repair helicase AddA, partial [Acidiphilium sp.]